jgi:hypothetical protein
MDSAGAAEIVTVYRTRDGGIHHTRCGGRIALQGRRAELELDFYCLACIESVTLPVYVLSRIPVVNSAPAEGLIRPGASGRGDRAASRRCGSPRAR